MSDSEKTLIGPDRGISVNAPVFVRPLPYNNGNEITESLPGGTDVSTDLNVNRKEASMSDCEDEGTTKPDLESTPLLAKPEGSEHVQNTVSSDNSQFRNRFYITISVILIIYKGCEEMASVTLKQFVYSWCENTVVPSDNSSRSNNIHESNSTDPCGHVGSKVTESKAQKMASRWELYFNLLNAVLVFFSVSIYGTMSDYFGRKPFHCMALLGYTLKCGITSAVIYFDLHIAWILVAYGIDGLCGSNYAVSMFTYVSTADMTQRSGSRILAIAIMEMILGIGRFSTQFGNGYFIHSYGYFYPMMTATAGCSVCVIFCLLTLKETKSAIMDLPQTKGHYPTCSTLIKRYISFYVKSGNRRDRTVFWLCLIVFALFELPWQGRSDTVVLYQLGSPFCWSSEQIGWYGAISVALWYVVGCLLLKPLQFCLSANTIACFGIISAIAFFTVTGLAPSTLWLYLATGFGLIMALPKPILRGLASTRASEKEQGAMFAGLMSSELICKIVSSPGSLSIYSASVDTLKGMVFFVFVGVDAVALVFMMCLTYVLREQTKESRYTRTVIQTTR